MKVKSRLIDHRIPLCSEVASELRPGKQFSATKVMYSPPPLETNISGVNRLEMYRVTLGLEGKHSPYGWRSSFSTLARDNNFERDVVELALITHMSKRSWRVLMIVVSDLRNVFSYSIGGGNSLLLRKMEQLLLFKKQMLPNFL